jgi:hypothetical protein
MMSDNIVDAAVKIKSPPSNEPGRHSSAARSDKRLSLIR